MLWGPYWAPLVFGNFDFGLRNPGRRPTIQAGLPIKNPPYKLPVDIHEASTTQLLRPAANKNTASH